MNVKDKVVVITGGASGIGFSCVEQLLLHNAKFVAIFDLPNPNGEKAVTKLNDRYGNDRAGFFPCDVTNDQQVESSFKKVMESFGSFDILINSAGILDDTRWELMVNVNVTGVIRTSLKAIDLIGKHKGGKGGTIVNVASMAGITPVQYLPLYASTKYAIVGLTSSLKCNYDKTGIRMMLMCPGITSTPLASKIQMDVCLDFVDSEAGFKQVDEQIRQSPECVAKGMIDLLEKGENGAACVIYNANPPLLVNIPTLNDLVMNPL